jgi:sugar phosphate isomerase/epimerase
MSERKVAAYPAGAGGIVPLRQFAALLERDNFEGYCSLEYEAAWQVPEKEGVTQSLEYLKQIRAIHQVI